MIWCTAPGPIYVTAQNDHSLGILRVSAEIRQLAARSSRDP